LRSFEKYCPWIRTIYLVTDNQIPKWMNTSAMSTTGRPSIKMVNQSDIFPNKSHLPTFNSAAIEWNIHRIPGLSEKFVYFNDDFLVLKPTSVSDFFNGDKP